MKLRIAFYSALLLTMLSGGVARADYMFLFTDSTGTSANSFTVGQGQTVDIRVYLAQSGTSTGLSAQGLDSAGVQLNTSSPSIATVTNTVANSAFDVSSTTTGANARVTENQTVSNPVKAPTTGPDANRVLLGTFIFTGMNTGTTLTVTAVPSTGTSVNVIAPGGSDSGSIDSVIMNASAAITVVAVPEPGSLMLVGAAASAIGFGAWRRRRKTA